MSKKVKSKLNAIESKIKEGLEKSENEKASVIHGGNKITKENKTMTTSSEKRLLQSFGVKDVKGLLEVNIGAPKYAHLDAGMKQAAIQLKQDIDCARFTAQIFDGAPLDTDKRDAKVKFLDSSYAKNVDLKGRLKAFGSEVVGEGDEWVPTLISQNYIEEFHLEQKLAKYFKQVPMASSPFELPVQTDSKKAKLVGEGATNTSRTFGTEKLSFSAKKASEFYELPEELNEDSAPAILQLARQEVVDAVTRAIESAIINGDTAGNHQDSDIVGDDFDKAWDGLRKVALAASSTTDFGGAAIDKTNLNLMRRSMGKYGVNPARLAWVFGPSAYAQAQNLEIVESLEKYGPNATVLSGALGVYNGIAVCVSEWVREDLNATGVYDGVTTDRTAIHLVNIDRFMMGMRRPIRIRVAQDPRAEFDRWQLVSYTRQAFTGHKQAGTAYASGTVSSERSSVLGINILA
jgi:HK97 family phage major capsid protein